MNRDFFLQLSGYLRRLYEEEFATFLINRGVDDPSEIFTYFEKDCGFLNVVFNELFSDEDIWKKILGQVTQDLGLKNLRLDHVGIELFGPFSFYLPFFEEAQIVDPWELNKESTFPSVQVFSLLKKTDPLLSGVMISKLSFVNKIDKRHRCLELFQVSSDLGPPQAINFTDLRMKSTVDRGISAINHIALEVSDKKDLEVLLIYFKSGNSKFQLYEDSIAHNPRDQSYQIKMVLDDFFLEPGIRILEFIYYSKNKN